MDDLVRVLTKFHRDIVAPDVERIVSASEGRLRDEMNGRFDALYQRFERLETEFRPSPRENRAAVRAAWTFVTITEEP